MKSTTIFENFYTRFYDSFEKKIKKNRNIKKLGKLVSLYDNLYNELFSLSYMTLIYELNNFRDNDLLEGNNSKARYNYFEKIIGEPFFQDYISQKYPVLLELLNSKVDHIAECVNQIIDSFYNDQDILEENFGQSFKFIEDIQIGIGDSHNKGESVAIISGEFGKILYKPNNLVNDIILNELIDIINPLIALKLKKVKVISRPAYGWQEYILHSSCDEKKQINDFYQRLGSYLALFYLLNSSDYHHENIIAAGAYPMIIDTETLITNGRNKTITDKSIYNLLQDNVLRSGLLPVNTPDSYLDIDMSGLTGGDLRSKKIEVMHIKNSGTDQMVLEKKFLEQKSEKSHVPYIRGEETNVLDYLKEFLFGFEDTMRALVDRKQMLKGWLEKDIFKCASFRQVLKATYVYDKILTSGTYPNYLINDKKRSELFEKVLVGSKQNKREKDELNILYKGYIPAYECYYNSMDLYRNNKLVEKNYFSETPKNVVQRKIGSLSDNTIRYQTKLIKCSILTVLDDLSIRDEEIQLEKGIHPTFESSFKAIIQEILTYEISLPDEKIKDIIQNKTKGNRYIIEGSNYSLYEGGGLLWSIYCYGIEVKNRNIQLTAECLLEKAEINYNKYKNHPEKSAFAETFGAVYLYYNFYKVSGNREYYTRYKKYLREYIGEIEDYSEWDYINGLSGVIHLLTNIYQDEHKDKQFLENIILVYANKLDFLLSENEIKEASFAHGFAGLSVAYSDLYVLTNDSKYLNKAIYLLENDIPIEIKNNKAWCSGLSGLLFAYAELLIKMSVINDNYNSLLEKFRTILKQYLVLPNRKNVCLCHGSSGELELLTELLMNYSILLTVEDKSAIEKRIIDIEKNIPIVDGNSLGVPYRLPLDGFMLGGSGVAYTHLRAKTKNRAYPSLLMLNISK